MTLTYQNEPSLSIIVSKKEIFQDDPKIADIAPLFKKENILNKENDQTIVILSCLSEVFEELQRRWHCKDIASFVEKKISPYLLDVTENNNVQ